LCNEVSVHLKQTKANRGPGRSAPRARKRHAVKARLLVFTRKFLLAAALTVIPISLVPEAWFEPLNCFTALMAAEVLRPLAAGVALRGTHLSVGGFSVSVIAECSAIHLVALYGAFLFAFPARRAQKWFGFGVGTALLLAVNSLRIAAVTWIGARFPALFEPAHVYLGQLGMLTTTIVLCLAWCRWIRDPRGMDGPMGFLLRFLVFSSLPFLLWVPLNTVYMGAVDGAIQWFFALASHPVAIPRTHPFYYQTFSLIALIGLLLAVKGPGLAMRVRWLACGTVVLTLLQIAMRLCNTWISAFHVEWLAPAAQVVYIVGVYALPPAAALGLLMRTRQREPAALSKGRGARAQRCAGTPSCVR
jgi:exosortase H (IPTLxxWG-CTERM-specific)